MWAAGGCPEQGGCGALGIPELCHTPLACFHRILLCFDSKTTSEEELAKLPEPTHQGYKIVKDQSWEVDWRWGVILSNKKYQLSQESLRNDGKLFYW